MSSGSARESGRTEMPSILLQAINSGDVRWSDEASCQHYRVQIETISIKHDAK
ncbi:hypothetical protein Syun_001774 [Stephania yunnanensis]|uniref:Uncharacterized protein n=1 Tax=Stephania yunnanensis TaxID=152371 RepID=A0AAP0LIH7_9MAGN